MTRAEKSVKADRAKMAQELAITYRFGFDAAHHFTGMPSGHRYRNVHGHSFGVEVTVRGRQQAPHGFVADFSALESACKRLYKTLDHTLLNDIPGLDKPSLENICLWIWGKLQPRFPGLARVTVRRDSLGQACSYDGA